MAAVSRSHLSSALFYADCLCDYIPGLSTIASIVDIIERTILKTCCTPRKVESNSYFLHIKNKPMLRCIVLLVPVLGNIIIGLLDLAFAIGRKMDITEIATSLAAQQDELRAIHSQFAGICDDPTKSIKIGARVIQGTAKEKIDNVWSYLKDRFSEQSLGNLDIKAKGLDQNSQISDNQRAISTFKDILLEIRRVWYKAQIKDLTNQELLIEAKKLLSSFDAKPQSRQTNSIENITIDNVSDALKERCKGSIPYEVVEMQEIISLIESRKQPTP